MSDFDTPYRGGFVGPEHRFALTVYFEDTDTAGVVYYANYLKFMERARSDMIRAVGVDQSAALRAGGSAYFVTHVNIRYRAPARLGCLDDMRAHPVEVELIDDSPLSDDRQQPRHA